MNVNNIMVRKPTSFKYLTNKILGGRQICSYLYTLGLLFILVGCGTKSTPEKLVEEPALSLKKAFSSDFLIGAAVNDQFINESDSMALALVQREYSTISPENVMKWMYIQPGPDTFNFETSDKYVALGKKQGQFTVGHTLVWHSQIAEYMNKVADSATMASYLQMHINTIVSRYKGKIDAWDVVNEALNEDGSLRESLFLKVLGEDYIPMAFNVAEKADPDVQLLYNDYNLYKPEKRAGVIAIVKQLKEKGIKIDGVGMQGHWSLTGPSLEDIENSIIAFSALGVKVSITELDITVLPNPRDLEGAEVGQNFEGSPLINPYPQSLPDSVQVQLAKRYQDIFKLFLKHKDKIERVTFWGVNDGESWLNNWPIKNRTNYPLLFDREYQPKVAYDSILSLTNQLP